MMAFIQDEGQRKSRFPSGMTDKNGKDKSKGLADAGLLWFPTFVTMEL